jgi:hypothetical protein
MDHPIINTPITPKRIGMKRVNAIKISSSQYKHEKLYNGHHKIQNKLAVKKMA